jgi:hypothetical protein
MVQLKDILEAPWKYIINSDGNFSLMGLDRGHSNTKRASFSTALGAKMA